MDQFYLAVTVLFHPVDTFRMIQADRSRFNYIPPITLLLMAFAARMFYLYQVHFPLSVQDVWQTTVFIEAVKLMLPIITWVVALYAVTAVMAGQCHFREILMAVSLSMVPYIILSVALALLSKILSSSEQIFFSGMHAVMWIWIAALMVMSIYTMNDYSARKTVLVIIISVLAVFLIWLVGILIYSLLNQIVEFLRSVAREIRMMR